MHIKILFNQRRNEEIERLDLENVDPRVFEDAEVSENDSQVDPLSFINDTTTSKHLRIIEHPAKTNCHYDEYRFCHPNNSRTRITQATFKELKDTLNKWTHTPVSPRRTTSTEVFLNQENTEDFIRKGTVKGKETISDMKLVLVHKHGWIDIYNSEVPESEKYCYKVAMFDTKNQVFLLRTIINKIGAQKNGYIKEINVDSFDPEWFVDRSTILATEYFWEKLREIINAKDV